MKTGNHKLMNDQLLLGSRRKREITLEQTTPPQDNREMKVPRLYKVASVPDDLVNSRILQCLCTKFYPSRSGFDARGLDNADGRANSISGP